VTVDFFLVTYPCDYDWLPYLWRSIERFATGWRRVVMVLEEQDALPDDIPSYVTVRRCRNYRGTLLPGYYGQCIEGLRAHEYTDADVVWFLESDTVFVRPIDVASDPQWPAVRPNLLYRSWDAAGPAQVWRESTRQAVGFDPLAETMCCHPFVYPRALLEDCWPGEACLRLVFRQTGGLSQFNVLGAWAMVKHPDMFRLVDVTKGYPPSCMRQFWSHARPTDDAVRAELTRLGLA